MLAIPFLPVGTIGTAVAFYVGFKNNASYERLWEGRKIWGSVANLCRAWGAILAVGHSTTSASIKAIRRRLVLRQITWCHALGLQLRSTPAVRNANKVVPEIALVKKLCNPPEHSKEALEKYLREHLTPEEFERVSNVANPAAVLIALQIEDLETCAVELDLDSSARGKLVDIAIDCLKEQGASERLKNFPFPR